MNKITIVGLVASTLYLIREGGTFADSYADHTRHLYVVREK